MKQTNWYKDAIIYQIYPRSFCDSNNDGLGDIPGIISKLDYLKDLGVNCLWLSPVYDSPQEDNGYDISNYLDIYPPFGTLDDMKTLIKEAHDRGIRILMDLVVNHTSSEHMWFKEAIKDKNSKYHDYYIIRKGRKNGKKPPNNWTGFFGEKAWEKVPGSEDEYYLRLFAKGQPDLNWENEEVREEVKKILRFWLDLGVDGFRCDVINLISKKQDFKNRFYTGVLVGKDAYINGPRLHEYLQELNRDVLSHYDCMTVGETVMTNLDDVKRLTAPDRHELTMVFNFDVTNTDGHFGVKYFAKKFSLRFLKKTFAKWQNGLNDISWNTLFLENHDQRRIPGRFGSKEDKYYLESVKMIAAMYFLMKGTPFIYEGQEIGMKNAPFKSIDEFKDVEIHNIHRMWEKSALLRMFVKEKTLFDVSRDNARTPMQWDDSEYAGFSKVEPWIKINPNKDEINVKKELDDPNSILSFYKKLIELRKNEPILRDGSYVEMFKRRKDLFVYKRVLNNSEIVVILSFKDKDLTFKDLSMFKEHKLMLSNYEDNDLLTLKPFECRVLKLEK